MAPNVSFMVMSRRGGSLSEVWRAIEAQDLPADEIEIHVLRPAPEMPTALPEISAPVTILLGDGMLPRADLARRAAAIMREVPDPERSVVVGRVTPTDGPDSRPDPISRVLASGLWCGFRRVTDPDRLGLDQFHTGCVCLPTSLVALCREEILAWFRSESPSAIRLARGLIDHGDARLHFRPGLIVGAGNTMPLEKIAAAIRRDADEAYARCAGSPAAAGGLDLPDRETLNASEIPDLEARIQRLLTIARELSRIDLDAVTGADVPELTVANRLTQLSEDVLRAIHRAARRQGWIDAAGRAPADRSEAAHASGETVNTIDVTTVGPPAPDTIEICAPESATGGSDVDVDVTASIIIVVPDPAADPGPCVRALAEHTPESHEIIVVGDSSSPALTDLTARTPHARLISMSGRPGYGRAVNEAIRDARGRHLVLLTPDAAPGPGWLSALIDACGDQVGAAGPVSNGLLGLQNVVRWIDDFAAMRELATLVDCLQNRSNRERPRTGLLQPLCVLIPGERGGASPARSRDDRSWRLDDGLETPEGAILELSWRLRRGGRALVVVPDSFVARRGGLPAATTDPDRIDRVRSDMRRLRQLIVDAGTHGDPDSQTIWGVQWTGFDELAGSEPHPPRLSVVIPVLNQIECTRQCLDSLRAGTWTDTEIIVFDNGSDDGTREYLDSRSDVTVLRSERNLGFAPAVNRALAAATGRHLLILNNDTVVPRRMLERLVSVMAANPGFGIVGPLTNESAPSQRIDVDYDDLEGLEAFADRRWSAGGTTVRPAAAVLGFALLARREVLDTIGLFDERFEVGNFEDNDLSLRAQVAGFQVGVAEGVFVHHYGSRTFIAEGFDYGELMRRNHERFVEKWRGSSDGDAAPAPHAEGGPAAPPPDVPPDEAGDDSGWIPLAAADGTPGPSLYAPGDAAEHEAAGGTEVPHSSAGGRIGDDGTMIDPPSGVIYLLANDRLEKGQLTEAEELFRWAIEKQPDMSLAHMGLGIVLTRLGRARDAVTSLETCVRLSPELSEGHNNLGIAYHLLGRDDEARGALEHALSLDPDNDSARANLREIQARADRA